MESYRFNSKAALAKALEGMRRTAKRIDAAKIRQRAADKRKALKSIKDFLKTTKKWEYDEWSKQGFSVLNYTEKVSSYCDASQEAAIDRAIAGLKHTQQGRFVISSSGIHRHLHQLLSLDIPATKTVCEL